MPNEHEDENREMALDTDRMSKECDIGEFPAARVDRGETEMEDKKQRKAKLGETVLGAINTLSREADEIYDDSSDELSTDLRDQLRGLRKLGKRFVESTKG